MKKNCLTASTALYRRGKSGDQIQLKAMSRSALDLTKAAKTKCNTISPPKVGACALKKVFWAVDTGVCGARPKASKAVFFDRPWRWRTATQNGCERAAVAEYPTKRAARRQWGYLPISGCHRTCNGLAAGRGAVRDDQPDHDDHHHAGIAGMQLLRF